MLGFRPASRRVQRTVIKRFSNRARTPGCARCSMIQWERSELDLQAKHDSLRAREGAHTPLYRGEDRVFAGVCSGIAEHMDTDAVVVRVTAVVLVLCTFGLAIIPYAALAAFLPSCREEQRPLDVDPLSICSDRYQRVVSAKERPYASQRLYGVHAGAGHIPPTPPEAADAPEGRRPCVFSQDALEFNRERAAHRLPVVLSLVVFIAALFAVAVNYGVSYMPQLSTWGFWPLLFVVVGTTLLVCFGHKLSLRVRLCGLVACIELCLAFLPFTLGICPVHSLSRIGDATEVLWLVVVACIAIALIFDRGDFLALGTGLAALALAITYFDMGVVDRVAMFSSYFHHNMTSPLFRG